MKGKGEKEESINKEEIAENWCFVCKDGGDLRICDYKQCLKSYHHFCVGKDELFLESEKKWNCAWHRCSFCRKSSYLHCYTCKNSACRRCLSTADILQVKGQYGFCKICLKLALLIEEKRDYDSDGGKVDFTDRETIEGLYMEYYMILKKDEGFELADIYAAKERVKKKTTHEAKSGSEDFDDEEEEEPISDYDERELQKKKRTRKQNKSSGQKSAKRTPAKSNKKEFIGWASRALAEFLGSIGKSTEEKLSQRDVTTIVNDYVKEKKLLNPEKKRFVLCDTRLYTLFRRKVINKSRIHELLEDHFAENHEESEEDDYVGSDSEDDNLCTLIPCKRQRNTSAEKKSWKNENVETIVPLKSRFASIVLENLKLVYLGRGVLKEMLKEAETFEEKVTGCFVRVKSDPYDCRPTSHQLVQVKGVKTILIDETNMETVLLLSAMPNEIRIPLVSDENITEEECEDLRKKVMAGEMERPTVEYIQHKVNAVHKDMTNHSIRKELNLLQHLYNVANEKGWMREKEEHWERRKKLKSSTELSRLLENVPTVIAEVYEPGCDSEDGKIDKKSDEGSSESNLPCNSHVPHDGQQDDKASDVYETDCDSKDEKSDEGSSESNPPCSSHVPSDGQKDHKASEEDNSRDEQTPPTEKDQTVSEKPGLNEPQQAPILDSEPEQAKAKECEGSKKIEVIDIPSDEDDDGRKDGLCDCAINDDELENETWCMRNPEGEVLRSLTLSVLRRWSEKSRYWSEFSVWRDDECEEDGIPLPEALSIASRKK